MEKVGVSRCLQVRNASPTFVAEGKPRLSWFDYRHTKGIP